MTEFEARHGRPSSRTSPKAEAGEVAGASARVGQALARSGPSPAERSRYEAARGLIGRAERNQSRDGERWSERDIERFGAADRELLRSSRDPADHAHRIGMQRAEFEALQGPERERAVERIEAETKRDRRRLEVASEVPGRIAGRGRQAAEGARQRIEGSASERREHLRRLRRERRASGPPARRSLSRGA